MIKICFVTTIYLTYHCFLKDFSNYLNATGEYDVSLICDESSVDRSDLPPFVHFLPVKMKRGINTSAIHAIGDIKEIMKRGHFDIVQYSTPNAAFYTSIAAKSAMVPVRLYCQWGIRYMGFSGWKRSLFKLVEKIVCRKSTFIEAESNSIRQFALSEGLYSGEKSCVIWNGSASGVDLGRYDLSQKMLWRTDVRRELGINDDCIVFMFAGRMTADKGINELLCAFFQIASVDQRAVLLILGLLDNDGTVDDDLYQKAVHSKQVIIPGSKEDIERYYAASDVFVSPSYREGFGLVIIEAAAMGVPAVVSNVPGQIDAIIPDITGLLCQVKDGLSLKMLMERLLNDQKLRETMGTAARKYVEESFDQRILFDRLMGHRNSLVEHHS